MVCNVDKFLGWGDFSTLPNSQAGGPLLVGCPQLLIQYICSYPPHPEAVPSGSMGLFIYSYIIPYVWVSYSRQSLSFRVSHLILVYIYAL
jgi:hypothetical protein